MKRILIIGSMNMDFVFQVHHMPAVGETVLTGDLTFIPGGKGAMQPESWAEMWRCLEPWEMTNTDAACVITLPL